MDLELLREFLNADCTLKDFAKTKDRSAPAISNKLTRQMRRLAHTHIFDAVAIIKNTSPVIANVRENRLRWLKAIEIYEREVVRFEDVSDDRRVSDLTVGELRSILERYRKSF